MAGVEARNAARGRVNAVLKKLSVALALFGLVLGTLLVGSFGFRNVVGAVLSAGWAAFAMICLWQVLIFQPLGLAWEQLGRARGLRRPLLFIWGRMVRDAAANCLPFSQLGGFVFGTRAIVLHGIAWPTAAATTIVDITAEFLAEVAFVGVGLSVLLARAPKADVEIPVEVGLGIAILVGILLIWVQRGATPLFARIAGRIAGRRMQGARRRFELLQSEMAAIYRDTGRLAACFGLHLVGWLASGFADWIAYRAIGVPVQVDQALAIEALVSAFGALTFLVPVGAGVLEASYAGFGALFGIPAEMSLAASLIRRARDVTVGVPILLAWQIVEVRRLREAPG